MLCVVTPQTQNEIRTVNEMLYVFDVNMRLWDVGVVKTVFHPCSTLKLTTTINGLTLFKPVDVTSKDNS
jgi:hypothetical protein